MTRYTICFDEEKDANILRWMDAQVNKSMSLKALVERSIAYEGYNDIFQLVWQRNIHNPEQIPDGPAPTTTEYNTQQHKRKRGRPRKSASSPSTSVSVIPETETAEQNAEHVQVDQALAAQPDIHQSINTAPSSTDNPEATSTSEISAEQNKKLISDKEPAIPEKQLMNVNNNNAEIENDGYRRPGNVNIDMARFFG